MSDDIVTRLRNYDFMRDGDFPEVIMQEAADEIERLRAMLSELRERHSTQEAKHYRIIRELEADRDRWRKIADRLISGAEKQIDEWRPAGGANTNDAWVSAWYEYDKAVRGE